ncbi:hypothetical protein [Hoeflea alexandrii]
MRIAVLAWGSLVWNRGELAIAEDFTPCGPHLPIEFCRVSGDGRLTLVIAEAFGASCITHVAASGIGDLEAAIENLSLRERMPGAKGVGFVDVASGRHGDRAMERHPKAVTTINAWAQTNGFDAAIWTALDSNFHKPDKAAKSFSVEAAVLYLEALDAPKRDAALAYIRSAPPEVGTPVRAAVAARWPEG